MMKRLRLWINRRFIHIVQVLGYTVSAIMGIGAIYCLVTHEDVLAYGNGSLTPLSESLAVAEECVVYDWLIESGGDVTAGTPVARIVTDSQSAQRLRAARYLARARESLDQAGEGSGGALRSINVALDDLDVVPPTQTLQSPMRGVVVTHQDANGTAVLAPETSLATTYDLEVLLFTAVLEATKAKHVAAGQVVRVTLDGVEEALEGRVVGEPEARDGGTIQIRFEQVPEAVQRVIRELLIAETASFPEVRATIVVGRRSLFGKLFGRSA
jgi:hypothetical protein